MQKLRIIISIAIIALLAALPSPAEAQKKSCLRPVVLTGDHDHDRFVTQPTDVVEKFAAYTTSFDGPDDDNGDGKEDVLGVMWVAYQINGGNPKQKSGGRPTKWCTDDTLYAEGAAGSHASYTFSKAFRAKNKDWYDRGHLAQKYHAERISNDAAWNTHTVLNAVPQIHSFNAGIWLSLECITGAWANKYDKVWIITGPIYNEKIPAKYIGENDYVGPFESGVKGLVPVPPAEFKIVVKENGEKFDALGFIYDNKTYPRQKATFIHEPHLVSIDTIEERTGLDFLTSLPDDEEAALESVTPTKLWTVAATDFASGCKTKAVDIE